MEGWREGEELGCARAGWGGYGEGGEARRKGAG